MTRRVGVLGTIGTKQFQCFSSYLCGRKRAAVLSGVSPSLLGVSNGSVSLIAQVSRLLTHLQFQAAAKHGSPAGVVESVDGHASQSAQVPQITDTRP